MNSQTEKRDEVRFSIMSAVEGIGEMENTMTEYDEVAVRKMIECIRVISKTEIQIIFKGGYECNAVVEK